jgi:hypothetical protein
MYTGHGAFHDGLSEMLSRSSEPQRHALPSDALSEVLQDLRLSGVSYGRCELHRPWGISFPPQGAARFHFLAAGDCWLHSPELGWTPLHTGDVALLPRGTGHALADTADGQTAYRRFSGKRSATNLQAGGRRRWHASAAFLRQRNFDEPAVHPLLQSPPG